VVDYETITTLLAIKAKTDNLPANPAAVSDIPTANQNRDAVWNASSTVTYVDGSMGDRILISSNNTREVQVNGNGHVASVLHESENGAIHEATFDTGALSARVIGTDAIDSDAMAASANTEIANAVAAIQVLSRLNSMIEDNGSGQFRFDTIAVSLAGGGGSGNTYNIQVEDRSITLE
jgi:hypothetical protein